MARPVAFPAAEHGDAALLAALDATTDARSACQAVVDHLVRNGYALPSVYLAQSGRLRCHAAHGYWQIADGMRPGSGIIGTVYRRGIPMLVRHGEPAGAAGEAPHDALPPVVSTLDDQGVDGSAAVHGEVAVPVRVHGRTVGVVSARSHLALPPDAVDVVARHAEALSGRLPFVAQYGQQSPTRRLTRHAVRLAAASSWGDAVERVLDAACDLTGMGTAVLAVHDQPVGGPWRVCGAVGPLTPALAGLTESELATVAGWLDEGTSSWTTGQETGAGPDGGAALRGRGVRALAVVPLDVLGDRIGFLLICSDDTHVRSTDEAELIELLGSLAAGSLRTLDAIRELGEMALRDALTGLGHHGRFHSDLRTALAAPHADEPAVLLLDLDRFKEVNDRGGHLHGDAVLRQAATAMAGALRGSDRAYRIGGDEFGVIVTAPAGDEALAGLAARVRDAVRAGIAPVTVSLGYARGVHGEDPSALVARADDALYAAKRGGRDGVARG